MESQETWVCYPLVESAEQASCSSRLVQSFVEHLPVSWMVLRAGDAQVNKKDRLSWNPHSRGEDSQ